jgi:hypothetical protein
MVQLVTPEEEQNNYLAETLKNIAPVYAYTRIVTQTESLVVPLQNTLFQIRF